jgi:hypothetical protein
MSGIWLANNGSDSMSTNDGPDEESNSSSWDNICLDSEQVTNLVNWEPDSREGAKPEYEERDKVARVGPGIGNTVMDSGRSPGWPNGSDHESNTFSPNPRLNSIPNTGHRSSVEDGP